ncbi:MAG: hypothetical protein ACI8W7_001134 [Gammaproteobacteria bacterium]|jgi:hypothetical protein
MNDITISSNDLLAFIAAIAVCFTIGVIYKLRRNLLRQRRAVELGERDIRTLTDRCDRQQISMTRLDQEVMDMRQAMLQQALALMPMGSAAHTTVAPSPVLAFAAPQPPAVSPTTTPHNVRVSELRASSVTSSNAVASRKPPVRRAASAKPPVASPALSPKTASKDTPVNPVQLARTGVKVDVLMSRCGLSRAEADLVLSVHGAAVRV